MTESPAITQSICKNCNLDIEGPFSHDQFQTPVYHDRGGNWFCPDTKFLHEATPSPEPTCEGMADPIQVRLRVVRALKMAHRCALMHNWEAVDAWIEAAQAFRVQMGE